MVTLNCDLGELEDEPEGIYALIDVANVACGGHAGDDASMRTAIARASAARARVFAHPSYADRVTFGRGGADVTDDALAQTIVEQLAALARIAAETGAPITGVKAHGALYHDLSRDPARAARFIEVTRATLGDVAIVGRAGGALARAAGARGLTFLCEGFVDRRYRDGELVPRTAPDALLVDVDACVAQALALGHARTFDTLCAHSDTPDVMPRLAAVRRALDEAGLLDRR